MPHQRKSIGDQAYLSLWKCEQGFKKYVWGVDESCYGRYHGESGFLAFSNLESIVNSKPFDAFPLHSILSLRLQQKQVMISCSKLAGRHTHSSGKGQRWWRYCQPLDWDTWNYNLFYDEMRIMLYLIDHILCREVVSEDWTFTTERNHLQRDSV